MTWGLAQLPDLRGKHAVVTGVTGGLGHHTALALARAGARVTVTGRDETRLRQSVQALADAPRDPRADGAEIALDAVHLDLADLSSVRRAAETVLAFDRPIDILVNNAGVMATPQRRTVDGFELQFGTNHLGHFALTGLLLPALGSARVVTVTSLTHRRARRVSLRDPRLPGPYHRWTAYAESKLANLQFAVELDRRARAAGLQLTSVASHPGYAATQLQSSGPRLGGPSTAAYLLAAVTQVAAQSAAAGALPSLYAATHPGLPGGTLVGPSGPGELRGSPRVVGMSRAAQDPVTAAALWQLSERATGVGLLS